MTQEKVVRSSHPRFPHLDSTMNNRPNLPTSRVLRHELTFCALLALIVGPVVHVEAQQRVGSPTDRSASEPPTLRRSTRNILGGVPMTAADSMHQRVVDLLEFDRYKALVRGLTQFGDREQGTPRNAAAVDWIEEQLRGWGYETERVQYMYTPRGGRGAGSPEPQPREEVYATKIGSTNPGEMYIVSAHMDGRGGGEAANDNGSGTALVMEIARALASSDIESDMSICFALWNNEETGTNGALAYVEQRAPLQGVEDPVGSGQYPEPTWLGMIQHDMMLWDHGAPRADGTVSRNQRPEADVNIEFQSNSDLAEESMKLAFVFKAAADAYNTDYPATVGPHMTNTDSGPFMNIVPSISLRENERGAHTGGGWNPTWHTPLDVWTTFSDDDFRLGLNAAQTTLSALSGLTGATVGGR